MERVRIHLKFGSGILVENKLFFLNLTFNGIFYIDIQDNLSLHFLGKVADERADAIKLSNESGFLFENAIYFCPNKTNGIIKYDVLTGQQGFFSDNKQSDLMGTAGIIDRQNKYCFFSNKGIYFFDLQLQNLEKDVKLSSLFSSEIFPNIFQVHDNCVLVSVYESNKFIEIDLDKKEIVCSYILQEDIKIAEACFDGKNYWILQTESTDIYEWDRERGTIQKYTNPNPIWEKNIKLKTPYSNMIFLENEILVLNYGLRNILHLNKEKKILEEPVLFPKGFELVNGAFRGWAICKDFTVLEDKVLIHPCRGNMLLIYDKETRQLSGEKMVVSEDDVPFLKQMINDSFFLEKRPCVELDDDIRTLNHFIESVDSNINKEKIFSVINAGELIYQKCEVDLRNRLEI